MNFEIQCEHIGYIIPDTTSSGPHHYVPVKLIPDFGGVPISKSADGGVNWFPYSRTEDVDFTLFHRNYNFGLRNDNTGQTVFKSFEVRVDNVDDLGGTDELMSQTPRIGTVTANGNEIVINVTAAEFSKLRLYEIYDNGKFDIIQTVKLGNGITTAQFTMAREGLFRRRFAVSAEVGGMQESFAMNTVTVSALNVITKRVQPTIAVTYGSLVSGNRTVNVSATADAGQTITVSWNNVNNTNFPYNSSNLISLPPGKHQLFVKVDTGNADTMAIVSVPIEVQSATGSLPVPQILDPPLLVNEIYPAHQIIGEGLARNVTIEAIGNFDSVQVFKNGIPVTPTSDMIQDTVNIAGGVTTRTQKIAYALEDYGDYVFRCLKDMTFGTPTRTIKVKPVPKSVAADGVYFYEPGMVVRIPDVINEYHATKNEGSYVRILSFTSGLSLRASTFVDSPQSTPLLLVPVAVNDKIWDGFKYFYVDTVPTIGTEWTITYKWENVAGDDGTSTVGTLTIKKADLTNVKIFCVIDGVCTSGQIAISQTIPTASAIVETAWKNADKSMRVDTNMNQVESGGTLGYYAEFDIIEGVSYFVHTRHPNNKSAAKTVTVAFIRPS